MSVFALLCCSCFGVCLCAHTKYIFFLLVCVVVGFVSFPAIFHCACCKCWIWILEVCLCYFCCLLFVVCVLLFHCPCAVTIWEVTQRLLVVKCTHAGCRYLLFYRCVVSHNQNRVRGLLLCLEILFILCVDDTLQ